MQNRRQLNTGNGTARLTPAREDLRQTALLLAWLSPSFPVGAFAYSHGLELAVEAGLVRNRETLADWLSTLLDHGTLRNDSVLLAATWHAVAESRFDQLDDVSALAISLQTSAERRLESLSQGQAFIETIDSAWPCAAVTLFLRQDRVAIAYPTAVGLAAAGHGVPVANTLAAYGMAFTGNLISAGIRLGVVGQTGGQQIQASLSPRIEKLAGELEYATVDDLGANCWVSDLCAMKHETQRTRLFRT